jgi:Na+-driven multidrug efflux pump
VLPHAFIGDDRVVERAQEIWWLFAALMPLNGVVFALDGILIGAGDTRFLMWGMLVSAAVYVPVAYWRSTAAGGSRASGGAWPA